MEPTFTHHKSVTYKHIKPGFSATTPEVIRISVTDNYATDDEDEEEDDHHPKMKKKFVNEIRIVDTKMGINKKGVMSLKQRPKQQHKLKTATSEEEEEEGVTVVGKKDKKLRGVRQRPSGRWAAEIRDPVHRKRVWLGTYDTAQEAAMDYDRAAIRLRGLNAVTNFINPTMEQQQHGCFDMNTGINNRDTSTKNDNVNCCGGYSSLSSPTSVLRFQCVEMMEDCEVTQTQESCLQDGYLFLDSTSISCYWDFESPPPIYLDETCVHHFVSDDNFSDVPFGLNEDFESCNWDVDSYFKDP